MGPIFLHPQYNKFRRFLTVFAGLHDLKDADLFCFENCGYKVAACYATRKHFDFTDGQLAFFFQINKKYLEGQLQEFAVQVLVTPEIQEIQNQAWQMHENLELTYLSYGVDK